jgi:hypothetical protein
MLCSPVESAGTKFSISSAGERYGGPLIAIPIAFFQTQKPHAWNVPCGKTPYSTRI